MDAVPLHGILPQELKARAAELGIENCVSFRTSISDQER